MGVLSQEWVDAEEGNDLWLARQRVIQCRLTRQGAEYQRALAVGPEDTCLPVDSMFTISATLALAPHVNYAGSCTRHPHSRRSWWGSC
jgi:hypothetical protein